jgi:hypothetical protein
VIVVCAGPPSAYTVALANPHRARPKVYGTASSMSVVHICVLTGAAVLVSPMRSVGPSWAHRAATSSKVNLVPGAATRHHNLMWKAESRPVRRGQACDLSDSPNHALPQLIILHPVRVTISF